MMRFTRRLAVAGAAALALAACNQAGGGENNGAAGNGGAAGEAALQDMFKGNADAKVEVIEYASWTCGACLDFHARVMPVVNEEYIDTGKIKFIFREFPTAPANISVAGFALARCAGEDKYFDVINELFERQPGILAVARQGDQVRAALETVAGNHGINGAEGFDACLENQDIRRAIGAAIDKGDQTGVSSTPTVFVNGEMLTGYDWRDPDGMRAVLDAALAEAGEAPAEPVSEATGE